MDHHNFRSVFCFSAMYGMFNTEDEILARKASSDFVDGMQENL